MAVVTTRDPRLWTPRYRAIRAWVLIRDGGLCQIHGPKCSHYATEVDHVVPRVDGGDVFDPSNMRASCKACNGWRAAKRTNDRRRYRTSVPEYETRL
jgi:5-methylcytosine-specific restriction endonuclease McrA